MELSETDSLASVNIPLPNLIVDEEEEIKCHATEVHAVANHKPRGPNPPPAMLTVPGQRVELCLEEDEVGSRCGRRSAMRSRAEDRPRSVLKVIRSVGRPLSALSARQVSSVDRWTEYTRYARQRSELSAAMGAW